MTRKEFTKRVKDKSPPSEFKKFGFMLKYVPPFYFDKFLLMANDGCNLPIALCKTIKDIKRLRVFFTDNNAYTNPKQLQKDFNKLLRTKQNPK